MPQTKDAIRKRIRTLREQIPDSERAACNEAITERVLTLSDYRHASTVLGYMNFGSEYASQMWVEKVLSCGKTLVLPKVNHHTNQLDLYLVEDLETQLAQGLWGIREPIVERCKRLNDINEVEFALLPGIAFTKSGARLGYGGGFYDKLLSRMSQLPALATAAFGLQIVAQLPQESTDIRVEWIVTETVTINCLEHL